MRNAGLDEAQTGIKIAGKNINNLRYADDTTLMEESKEELKSLLLKVKEESGNTVLKLNIQKMKVLPYIKMNLPQVYMCSPSCTLLLPSSPYHPSGLSQCTSPKHPVLCIEPGLAKPIQYCKVKYNKIKKK